MSELFEEEDLDAPGLSRLRDLGAASVAERRRGTVGVGVGDWSL